MISLNISTRLFILLSPGPVGPDPGRSPAWPHLDFRAFDADHHYYEAEDAFIRHVEPRLRAARDAVGGGQRQEAPAGRRQGQPLHPEPDLRSRGEARRPRRVLPRAESGAARTFATLFGQLDPIDPAYRDRDARLAPARRAGPRGLLPVPDARRRHGGEPEARSRGGRGRVPTASTAGSRKTGASPTANRLFAAPYFTLLDVDAAVRQLDWALAHGARLICMRAGPVAHPHGSTLAGRPALRPLLGARERGRHHGRLPLGRQRLQQVRERRGAWAASSSPSSTTRCASCLSPSALLDTLAALICHGLFDRFPNLRIATIESGSDWVAPLLKKLKKAYGQMPMRFKQRPGRAAPAPRLGLAVLRGRPRAPASDTIGADHILFGSDYPARRGPGRAHRLRPRPQGLRRGRGAAGDARERAAACCAPWRAVARPTPADTLCAPTGDAWDATTVSSQPQSTRCAPPSRICRAVAQRLVTADTLEKKDQSPVTVADFASQAIVCQRLERALPGRPRGRRGGRRPSCAARRRRSARVGAARGRGRAGRRPRRGAGAVVDRPRRARTPTARASGRSTRSTAPRASCAASSTPSRSR